MTPEQMRPGSTYLATINGYSGLAWRGQRREFLPSRRGEDVWVLFDPSSGTMTTTAIASEVTGIRPAAVVDANVCAWWSEDGGAMADNMKRDEAMRVIDDAFWNATHDPWAPGTDVTDRLGEAPIGLVLVDAEGNLARRTHGDRFDRVYLDDLDVGWQGTRVIRAVVAANPPVLVATQEQIAAAGVGGDEL